MTTDFGYKDPFIAEMKGVILSINRNASIIDLTHDIQTFNIDEAAFVINSSYKYFPDGSLHIVVIDPGVGSSRRAMIIRSDKHYFVGPDNGVFSLILNGDKLARCVEIANAKYVLKMQSPTFQGRDIFAPAAAWLSSGVDLSEIGPEIEDPTLIAFPIPQISEAGLTGEVIYVDRFGNAITNITERDLAKIGDDWVMQLEGLIPTLSKYYSELQIGKLGCLVNSSGHLEIFSYRGSAAALFNVGIGNRIVVSAASKLR